jgi:hypothetical protein
VKRSHIIALLGVSVLAGALLLAPRQSEIAPQQSCGNDTSACGTDQIAPAATVPEADVPPIEPMPNAVAPPASGPAPIDATALRDEADRLIAEGEVLEGIEVFRKAVEADPSARNHGDLGSLLYRFTAFDEAGIHLRAAAELDPNNADRWIALANLYSRKVDPGEAWKAEKRAREAEPGLALGRDSEGMRVRK